ncbi:hypothetical protein GCM10011335_31680 [Aureimonas glaciei]|uniref:Uncharacterized protein n=1 Tax=Aureimonas glaciei TaxID=1776957 RepID=A0A916Y0V9_9HYPH|nr:hypothetical protein GCM10011335_31680 [Aureimonas glaciei]
MCGRGSDHVFDEEFTSPARVLQRVDEDRLETSHGDVASLPDAVGTKVRKSPVQGTVGQVVKGNMRKVDMEAVHWRRESGYRLMPQAYDGKVPDLRRGHGDVIPTSPKAVCWMVDQLHDDEVRVLLR